VVLKTSTRQTIFLPVVGLVDAKTLKPGDLVGVNKDSYLILDALPAEYDSRVKVRFGPGLQLHLARNLPNHATRERGSSKDSCPRDILGALPAEDDSRVKVGAGPGL